MLALAMAAAASLFSLAMRTGAAGAGSGGNPGSDWYEGPVADRVIDFTLKDLKGKPMRLSDFRGHPVIVDFWATWCPPCRKQVPELESIYERYRSRGLMVVGVACDTIRGDGTRAVAPFVRGYHVQYPILFADDALVDRLDVDALPTTLFVDRDGKLVSRVRGAGPRGELLKGAKELVGH